MKSDLHDVDVIFQTETERAVCIRKDEKSTADIWIPKSQCVFDGPNVPARRGDVVILTASESVLTDKGTMKS
jgi:hypothetical protein